jgi:hypothetical protein
LSPGVEREAPTLERTSDFPVENVNEEALAKFVRSAYSEPDRPLEKVLVRSVNQELYAVQCWFQGEREPEGFYLEVRDEDEET